MNIARAHLIVVSSGREFGKTYVRDKAQAIGAIPKHGCTGPHINYVGGFFLCPYYRPGDFRIWLMRRQSTLRSAHISTIEAQHIDPYYRQEESVLGLIFL